MRRLYLHHVWTLTVAHSQTDAPGSGQLPGASAHLDVLGKDMIAENRAEGQCCSDMEGKENRHPSTLTAYTRCADGVKVPTQFQKEEISKAPRTKKTKVCKGRNHEKESLAIYAGRVLH